MMKDGVVVLGVDPGTIVTGYGVVCVCNGVTELLDFGCIRPPQKAHLSDRYFIIFQALQTLVAKYRSTEIEMAIESQFFSLNAQSALKVGMAQGVAIIAAKEQQARVFTYSPRQVKRSIVGTGKATKQQMQSAVARTLSLRELPEPHDAADALGLCLCHIAHRQKVFQLTTCEV